MKEPKRWVWDEHAGFPRLRCAGCHTKWSGIPSKHSEGCVFDDEVPELGKDFFKDPIVTAPGDDIVKAISDERVLTRLRGVLCHGVGKVLRAAGWQAVDRFQLHSWVNREGLRLEIALDSTGVRLEHREAEPELAERVFGRG